MDAPASVILAEAHIQNMQGTNIPNISKIPSNRVS
jgi:hypothetical protein